MSKAAESVKTETSESSESSSSSSSSTTQSKSSASTKSAASEKLVSAKTDQSKAASASGTALASEGPYQTDPLFATAKYYDVISKHKGMSSGSTMSLHDQQSAVNRLKEISESLRELLHSRTANGGFRVYIMRHGERMDRIFPGWVRLAFTDMGKYKPFDLNMPKSLPESPSGPEHFKIDSPITEMGQMTCQMIGRALRKMHVNLSAVYSSPALRCIQSAHQLLKEYQLKSKICIEPGLFEWMAWYDSLPVFISPDDLKKQGFDTIDIDYQPVLTVAKLMQCKHESIELYYERTNGVVKRIIERSSSNAPILIMGHGTTIDAFIHKLTGKEVGKLELTDIKKMGERFPYSCVVAVEEREDKQWELIPNPIPAITSLDSSTAVDFEFIYRN